MTPKAGLKHNAIIDSAVLGSDAANGEDSEEHPTVILGSSNDTQGERALGEKPVLRLHAYDKLRLKAMGNGESISDSLRRRAVLLEEKRYDGFQNNRVYNSRGS